MKYKLLGQSGLRVSELALGTMTFSVDNPWGWGTDKENSLKLLKKFSEEGFNFIDTANNYQNGQSEEVIGEFIQDDRDRYVIATKYTLHNPLRRDDINAGGNHRKNLFRSVEASLDRLQTNYIDLLYLHVWDYTTPIEEVMRSLNILIEQQKVNYIGISDSPAWVAAQANQYAKENGLDQFIAYQFPYHIARRDMEDEVIPYAKWNDLSMLTWGVLGGGLFTGKYTRSENGSGRVNPENLPEGRIELAEEIDQVADEMGITSAQTALAWARAQDKRIIPIVGANNVEQLNDTMKVVDIELEEKQLSHLNEISSTSQRFPQSFTGSDNVQDLIYGDKRVDNHRFMGY